MARAMILIPKVKYEKLLSDGDKPENIDQLNGTNGKVKEVEKELQDKEMENTQDVAKEQEKPHFQHGNDDVISKTPPTEVPRRSIRKRKQRGGKLYVKSTPSDFLRNAPKRQTKRKWLTFKL